METRRIEGSTDEGVVDGRLFLPEGDGPWPLAVFYMDAGGLRPAMSDMAGRLVDAGYAVVQPNLYWRAGPFEPFDAGTLFSDPDERARVMALVRSVRGPEAMSDTTLLVDAVAADPRIRADRFGCVGYCLGGRMAFVAAAALPDRVVAAASIHGGGLVTDAPDSPHLAVGRIRGTVYLGVADEDQSCTPEQQAVLEQALGDAGVDYALEVYPGAKHGFAVPDFPVFDPAAAERHWRRVLSLFGETLVSSA